MKDFILAAREDEEKRLKLVKNFEPLIKKCIKIYVKDKSLFEDAMQHGYLTVIACIKNYDLNSKSYFEAYVKRGVIYAMRDFARRIKSEISLDEEAGEEGGSLLDILKSDDDIEGDYFKNEEVLRLKRAMESLTEGQRKVIEDFYFRNISMREICRVRRCHYASIVQMKERAIKRLRDELIKC